MHTLQQKVMVIGAGLAGLTFAYRLQQKGYQAVALFEARGRIGGRVQSAYLKNLDGDYSVVEFGGQNLADSGDCDHVLNLIKEMGLETVTEDAPSTTAFHDGEQVYQPIRLITPEVRKVLTELQTQFPSLAKPGVSVQAVVDTVFPKAMSKELALIKRIFTFYITSYEGASLDTLAAFENSDVVYYTLKILLSLNPNYWSELTIKEGVSTLTLALAEKLAGRIHLNKVLRGVSLRGQQIRLTFADGSVEEGDKLVLAIPAPCYRDIQFEAGVIPDEQLQWIHQIQYGFNAKAIVPIKQTHLPYHIIFTDSIAGTDDAVITWLNEDETLLTFYFRDDDGGNSIDQQYPKALDMVKDCYRTQATFNEQVPVHARDDNFPARRNLRVRRSTEALTLDRPPSRQRRPDSAR